MAVIDFGSRIGNIHNSYKAGGNWERDMFIESSSFVASAGAGTIAVSAGTAALGKLALVVAATPAGWIALIVGGVLVAGIAAGAAITSNTYAKEQSGDLYDNIIKWINSL